jgi:hypothetical protein
MRQCADKQGGDKVVYRVMMGRGICLSHGTKPAF